MSHTQVIYSISYEDINPATLSVFMKPEYLRRFVSDVKHHKVCIREEPALDEWGARKGAVRLKVDTVTGMKRRPGRAGKPRYYRVDVKSGRKTWRVYFFYAHLGVTRITRRRAVHQ
jgi:hypothetical protein